MDWNGEHAQEMDVDPPPFGGEAPPSPVQRRRPQTEREAAAQHRRFQRTRQVVDRELVPFFIDLYRELDQKTHSLTTWSRIEQILPHVGVIHFLLAHHLDVTDPIATLIDKCRPHNTVISRNLELALHEFRSLVHQHNEQYLDRLSSEQPQCLNLFVASATFDNLFRRPLSRNLPIHHHEDMRAKKHLVWLYVPDAVPFDGFDEFELKAELDQRQLWRYLSHTPLMQYQNLIGKRRGGDTLALEEGRYGRATARGAISHQGSSLDPRIETLRSELDLAVEFYSQQASVLVVERKASDKLLLTCSRLSAEMDEKTDPQTPPPTFLGTQDWRKLARDKLHEFLEGTLKGLKETTLSEASTYLQSRATKVNEKMKAVDETTAPLEEFRQVYAYWYPHVLEADVLSSLVALVSNLKSQLSQTLQKALPPAGMLERWREVLRDWEHTLSDAERRLCIVSTVVTSKDTEVNQYFEVISKRALHMDLLVTFSGLLSTLQRFVSQVQSKTGLSLSKEAWQETVSTQIEKLKSVRCDLKYLQVWITSFEKLRGGIYQETCHRVRPVWGPRIKAMSTQWSKLITMRPTALRPVLTESVVSQALEPVPESLWQRFKAMGCVQQALRSCREPAQGVVPTQLAQECGYLQSVVNNPSSPQLLYCARLCLAVVGFVVYSHRGLV